MRILLVEDDLKIASFIVKGLKAAGYAVDHSTDGEEGLHLALTQPYDAAIIDIMLPKLDGFKLIERIVKKNQYSVIILRRKIDDRVRLQTEEMIISLSCLLFRTFWPVCRP
jgi:two-component system OmpR family response regulator